MEKIWNLLFYSTWILLRDSSYTLIKKPLQTAALKLYPKKYKKRFSEYQKYIKREHKQEQNPIHSSTIHHAFKFMLVSTGFAISLVLIFLNKIINLDFPNMFYLGLFACAGGSIFINYYFLYTNDKYLQYFKPMGSEISKKKAYSLAFLYHLLPIITLLILIQYSN